MFTKGGAIAPQPSDSRHAAAAVLLSASRMLAQLARRVRRRRKEVVRLPPVLEFYADAGAPEGALYVDGQLVGHLLGVTRL